MICRQVKAKLYVEKANDDELDWFRNTLTWYEREGTMSEVRPGDFIKIDFHKTNRKVSRKVARVTKRNGKIIEFMTLDGVKGALPFYAMHRVAPRPLYAVDEDGLFTMWGLGSLLQERAPFDIKILDGFEPAAERYTLEGEPLTDVTLLHHQRKGIEKCFTLKRGGISVPTSGGKTNMIGGFLMEGLEKGLVDRAIIVVPSVPLAEQFVTDALNVGFTRSQVGALHGSSKNLEARIIAAVMASAVSLIKSKDPKHQKLLDEVNTLIIDEGHHSRSDSIQSIMDRLWHADYMLAFSGSIFLHDDPLVDIGDAIVFGMTGGPIFKVDYEYLIEIGLVARPVVFMKKVGGPPSRTKRHYNAVYDDAVVNNKKRNEIVLQYTRRFSDLGLPTLILVQRVEHAKFLCKELADEKTMAVMGNHRGFYYSDLHELVEVTVDYERFRADFERGIWNKCIATTVFDEGVSIPAIGAVIIAGAGSSRIKVLQRLGRGLRRKKKGLNQVVVLDFDDRDHVFMMSQSKKRLALYEEAHAEIMENEFAFNNRAVKIARSHSD